MRSRENWAAGKVAFAAGDFRTATEKFSSCETIEFECRLDLVRAYERSGDKAGAEKAKAEILKHNFRDVVYAYVHTQLVPADDGG